MIRDLVRTACVIAAMTAGSALVIDTRHNLAAIDLAHRQAMQPLAPLPPTPQPPAPPGRLRAVGRAMLDLADAGLGVIR